MARPAYKTARRKISKQSFTTKLQQITHTKIGKKLKKCEVDQEQAGGGVTSNTCGKVDGGACSAEPLYPWNPQDIIDTISINDINSINDTGQQARHKPRGTWADPTLLSFFGSRRFQRHHSILAILQIGTPTPFLRRDCFYKAEQ